MTEKATRCPTRARIKIILKQHEASDMFSKSHLSSPHAHLFEKLGRIFLSVTTVIEAGTSQSLYGMAVSFGLFMYFGLTCPHVDPEDNSIRSATWNIHSTRTENDRSVDRHIRRRGITHTVGTL